MSICNVHVERERVLIAVDTKSLAVSPDGERTWFHGDKAGVQGEVVIAGTGNLDLITYILLQLRAEHGRKPAYIVLRRLVSYCEAASTRFKTEKGPPPAGLFSSAESAAETVIVAAGFDETKGRCRAVVASLKDEAWSVEEIPSTMHSPGIYAAAPPMGTRSEMQEVARDQVAKMLERYPNAPIGGDLIFYEVRPQQIHILRVGGLE